MNRRNFLSAMIQSAAACAVLPSALTYKRTWKALESGLVVPGNWSFQIYERNLLTGAFELKQESHPEEFAARVFGPINDSGIYA